MILYEFKILKIQYGDTISIANERGEVLQGRFEDNFDDANETFLFNNFSNGRTETIYLKNINYINKS